MFIENKQKNLVVTFWNLVPFAFLSEPFIVVYFFRVCPTLCNNNVKKNDERAEIIQEG